MSQFRPRPPASSAPLSAPSKVPPASTAQRTPLEIVTIGVESLRPSVLLQGGSGTGKTEAIRRLFAMGRRPLVLAVEPKMQLLAQYKPQVVFIYGGTMQERYDRVRQFTDELAAGRFGEFDNIAIDGAAEVADIIYRVYKAKTPRSNTLPMWEDIGLESVDFFRSLRDAAGYVSKTKGLPPIGIIATMAERRVVSPLGQVFYEPMLPGKKAITALPFQFEAVLRLAVGRDENGMPRFEYHTVSSDEWYAKSPPGVLPPVVYQPDFAEVHQSLMDYYFKAPEKAPETT